MSRRLTTEEFIEKAKAIHEDRYDYSKSEYISSKDKICIICPEHGEFFQTPNSHLRKKGYAKCRGMNKTTEDYIKQAKEVHGGRYDYSDVKYINRATKIHIICRKHGGFWQDPANHLSGSGCPKCSDEHRYDRTRKTTETFIKQAKKVHGNKYDYSKVRYNQAREEVCIICYKHGEFWQKPSVHLLNHGCPTCSGKKKRDKDQFLNEAQEIHKDRYDYSKVKIVNNNTKVCIICPELGEFWQTPHNHIISKQGCPKCGVKNSFKTRKKLGTLNTSKAEENLYLILLDKFDKDDILRQYIDKRYPYSCDFYIKSLDLFIELNAHWTHGGHWFDENNKEDNEKFRNMLAKSINSNCYINAINVWTKRDPEKHQCAIKNNLNYIVFWDNDLTDAKEWLETL